MVYSLDVVSEFKEELSGTKKRGSRKCSQEGRIGEP